jgi:hypothetical protein
MTTEQKEEARKLALEYLAERPALAFRAKAIAAGIKREHSLNFTDEQMTDALAVYESAGFVEKKFGEGSSVPQYQATAKGVLEVERGTL